MRKPFLLSEWVKDKTQKVVNSDGREVKIVSAPPPPQFYEFCPENIDPGACVIYMAITEGCKVPSVICECPSCLFFDIPDGEG